MRTTWENNGEPVDGKIRAIIDAEDGSGVQVFEGETVKEVADKLMVAQANATAKIKELAAKPKVEPTVEAPKPTLVAKPRELTADERFRVAADMTDPSKAPEAIRTVVEAATGVSLAKVGESMAQDEEDRKVEASRQAVADFLAATPDYYHHEHNRTAITRYLELQGWDVTVETLTEAYKYLGESGLLIPKPKEGEGGEGGGERIAPPKPAPAVRPRGVFQSSGVRASDANGGGGAAPTRANAPKYTREQILMMPKADYQQKFDSEAGFAKLVDEMFGTQASNQ